MKGVWGQHIRATTHNIVRTSSPSTAVCLFVALQYFQLHCGRLQVVDVIPTRHAQPPVRSSCALVSHLHTAFTFVLVAAVFNCCRHCWRWWEVFRVHNAITRRRVTRLLYARTQTWPQVKTAGKGSAMELLPAGVIG